MRTSPGSKDTENLFASLYFHTARLLLVSVVL